MPIARVRLSGVRVEDGCGKVLARHVGIVIETAGAHQHCGCLDVNLFASLKCFDADDAPFRIGVERLQGRSHEDLAAALLELCLDGIPHIARLAAFHLGVSPVIEKTFHVVVVVVGASHSELNAGGVAQPLHHDVGRVHEGFDGGLVGAPAAASGDVSDGGFSAIGHVDFGLPLVQGSPESSTRCSGCAAEHPVGLFDEHDGGALGLGGCERSDGCGSRSDHEEVHLVIPVVGGRSAAAVRCALGRCGRASGKPQSRACHARSNEKRTAAQPAGARLRCIAIGCFHPFSPFR